jgi:hypothetical protein
LPFQGIAVSTIESIQNKKKDITQTSKSRKDDINNIWQSPMNKEALEGRDIIFE